eukprot:COSAG02_NODE_4826_length_4934_cov_13.787590_1_plen_467_part_00
MSDANVGRSSIVESESDLSRLKHRSGVNSGGCVMTSISGGMCCGVQSLLLCVFMCFGAVRADARSGGHRSVPDREQGSGSSVLTLPWAVMCSVLTVLLLLCSCSGSGCFDFPYRRGRHFVPFSGTNRVPVVTATVLAAALEAATADNGYDDPGGWKSLIDDAIERHEVVDESFLSVEIAGVDKSSKSTTVPEPVKSKSRVCLFITDTLMAQNGVEFVAGLDTYNGTTAYCSYDMYKRCGGKELLKIDLRVAHVGGGQLKIYGLWAKPVFMNHGNPMSFDIVVGDFRVMTCECLLGIPALCDMHGVIDCRAGLMDYVDTDGNVQIFGKNRSNVSDLDGYVSAIAEHRQSREVHTAGGIESQGEPEKAPPNAAGIRPQGERGEEEYFGLDKEVAEKGLKGQGGQHLPLAQVNGQIRSHQRNLKNGAQMKNLKLKRLYRDAGLEKQTGNTELDGRATARKTTSGSQRNS